MRECLEQVRVQGEALFFHQFMIGVVVDVVEKVKSCTKVGMIQNLMIRLLYQLQNAIQVFGNKRGELVEVKLGQESVQV